MQIFGSAESINGTHQHALLAQVRGLDQLPRSCHPGVVAEGIAAATCEERTERSWPHSAMEGNDQGSFSCLLASAPACQFTHHVIALPSCDHEQYL